MKNEFDVAELLLLRYATHEAIMSSKGQVYADLVKLAEKLDNLLGVEDGE